MLRMTLSGISSFTAIQWSSVLILAFEFMHLENRYFVKCTCEGRVNGKENICSENISTHEDGTSVTSLFAGKLDVLEFECSVAKVLLISCKGTAVDISNIKSDM